MSNLKLYSLFYAKTIMDEIYGWEDEEKRGGIQIRRMYVDLHVRSVDKRTNTESSNGGVLDGANDVHNAMHEPGLCWHFR